MRYQKEIEEFSKILEEFGSKVLTKYVLGASYREGIGRKDLASLGHKLANMSAIFKHMNTMGRFLEDLQKRDNNLRAKFSDFSAPEKTLWVKVQKALQHDVEYSLELIESYSRVLHWLREDVESILTTSGHCDLSDLLPYLEVDNKDQIDMLQIMLQWVYPNGESCCNRDPIGSVLSHKITDSQNTPTGSPNISCDSTVSDTGIPEGDSSKMILGVQNTKQNYKTKALKMSKGSVPQMLLVKRRKPCGKIKKFQTPRMSKKKLKSQLDMGAQLSLKSKHNNNTRLHDNTLNKKFIELRGIMESVMGAFHNTFPLQDRLLLRRPRVKIK